MQVAFILYKTRLALTTSFTLRSPSTGTDAPALGLAISQEQMKLRQMKDEEDGDPLLRVEHNFSCEVDPFKQAYLARNFDSMLYPE